MLRKGIRRHISGFNLYVPTRYYKFFKSDYEQDNINFIKDTVKSGMTVIDVGAHIGLLSVIMAQKAGDNGRVYSFEPTPSTYQILKNTIKINKMGNLIVPIQKAVSEKEGLTHFYVTDIEAHNSNSLSNNNRDYGNEHQIEVKLTSIDEFKGEHRLAEINLIKIDAEGAELSVLRGATFVIDLFKPKIILALHPESLSNFGHSLTEIWDFIQLKNYMVSYKSNPISKEFFIKQTDLFDVFLT